MSSLVANMIYLCIETVDSYENYKMNIYNFETYFSLVLPLTIPYLLIPQKRERRDRQYDDRVCSSQ